MENQTNTMPQATDSQDETVITYPTKPDAEGWFIENEGQAALNIESHVSESGDMLKRVKLSGGRTAIVRELTGKENNSAVKIAGKKQDLLLPAMIAIATKIIDKDGNEIKFVAEDLDGWKAKDVNRLSTACSQLNF